MEGGKFTYLDAPWRPMDKEAFYRVILQDASGSIEPAFRPGQHTPGEASACAQGLQRMAGGRGGHPGLGR